MINHRSNQPNESAAHLFTAGFLFGLPGPMLVIAGQLFRRQRKWTGFLVAFLGAIGWIAYTYMYIWMNVSWQKAFLCHIIVLLGGGVLGMILRRILIRSKPETISSEIPESDGIISRIQAAQVIQSMFFWSILIYAVTALVIIETGDSFLIPKDISKTRYLYLALKWALLAVPAGIRVKLTSY